MVKDPFVSVCLITYNQAPYVEKALKSILAQDFNQPWEIVIADDVSTDGTTQILHAYRDKFPGLIRVLDRHKNLGPGPNFVDLIKQARGKYIAYLEGDDYWSDPSKLTKQIAHLEANPDIALIWHNYHIIDENDKIITANAAAASKKNYSPFELKQINSIKSLTICFRNLVREFPANYLNCPNGDSYLYVLLGGHGGAAFLPEIEPSCYRVHTTGTWSLLSQLKKDQKAALTFEEMAVYLKNIKDFATCDYYLDRLIKTMYVIAYHYRTNKNVFQFIKQFFIAMKHVARFKKWKWLPSVIKNFWIIGQKSILPIWQHREQ